MRYLEEVVTLQLDQERCNGCGMCVTVCPHAVFGIEDSAGPPRDGMAANRRRAVLVDRGACMECGACARNCESGAIRVRSGVGCAAGVLAGMLAGTEPTCGCSGDSGSGASSSC